MTKKDMRKELDLNLSVELWHDCTAGYLSILRFASIAMAGRLPRRSR